MVDYEKYEPLWKDVTHLSKFFNVTLTYPLPEQDVAVESLALDEVQLTLQLALHTNKVSVDVTLRFPLVGYPNVAPEASFSFHNSDTVRYELCFMQRSCIILSPL
jgi:hypothetical protein